MDPRKRGERQKRLEERPVLGEAGGPTQGPTRRQPSTEDRQPRRGKRSYERPSGTTRVRKKDKQAFS